METDGPMAVAEKKPSSPTKLGRRSPLPKHPAAQLALLVSAPPRGDEWLHELKFDGYRMFAVVDRGKVVFRSRNDQDWTHALRSLVDAIAKLPVKQAVIDGEVVVLDERGLSHFQLLQNALGRNPGKAPLLYFAFDLLHLDGRDLTPLPLEQRKAELHRILSPIKANARVRYSDHVAGHGDAAYRGACRDGLEGIISKLRNAPYRPGRGGEWVKCKCHAEQEFVIGGYSEPSGSRSGFGSLLLGYYDRAKQFKYAGRVGTGFTEETLHRLTPLLKKLESKESPFVGEPRPDRRGVVHWLRPKLVAQVRFSNWTDEGMLRQPSFQGLRDDKPATKVTRERAVARPRRRSR